MTVGSLSLRAALFAQESPLSHDAAAAPAGARRYPEIVKCPFLRAFLKLRTNPQSLPARQAGSVAVRANAGPLDLPESHNGNFASLLALEQLKDFAPDRYTKEKSSVLVLGLSVHTASVEMREKLSISEAEWPRAIGELCDFPHIEEAAILSTCNRMEIYVVALSWHRGLAEVSRWMSKVSGIPVEELREHLFVHRNEDATEHLFRVASGLDSLVLGESQILAQVKQVLKIGQATEGFGRNLNCLFKQAISAGKRVRSETSIAAGAVSVSSAAVELAASKLLGSSFGNANVLIIGAGKMATLLIKHLISKGCTRMVVVNRTEQRVRDLQVSFPEAVLEFQPFHEMMSCIAEAHLVFTCTASESPLLFKSNVKSLPPPGAHVAGIRYFIDISVPRNVATSVGELASTYVYKVDDLRDVVAANQQERKKKALEAQIIIKEEIMKFKAWRDSLETVPTIKKLRAYAEKIRLQELEKCLGKMGDDLSKKDKKLIDELSRGIVNKLLHGPMTHLRCDGTDDRTVAETLENMHALERMFNLASGVASLEQQMMPEQMKL